MTKSAQKGNVSVEFISIIVFLIMPICYLAIGVMQITETYLTMTSASRTGARTYIVQANDSIAKQTTRQVVSDQLRIGRLNPMQFSISISCTRNPCLKAGNYVTVTISGSESVRLPLLNPLKVSLKSSQTLAVDSIR